MNECLEKENNVSLQQLENMCTLQECKHCHEMVDNDKLKRHIEICQEALKYLDEQTCLICDADFNAISEVFKHIKQEHLDIIFIMENPSEGANIKLLDVKKEVKEEIVNSNANSNISLSNRIKLEDIKETLEDVKTNNILEHIEVKHWSNANAIIESFKSGE